MTSSTRTESLDTRRYRVVDSTFALIGGNDLFSGTVMDQPEQGASIKTPVRVLIVDDHEVLAVSLARVLDAEADMVSVGVAGTLAQARTMVTTTSPDVMLLDHRLPDGDGVSAIG